LSIIPDEDLRLRIEGDIKNCRNSVERWNLMSAKINQYLSEKKNPKTSQHILSEIMLQYTYPRYIKIKIPFFKINGSIE